MLVFLYRKFSIPHFLIHLALVHRLAEAGSLLVSVGAGVVLYLLLLYLLRVEELGLAVQMLRRRLGR